jgi:hypothetical protein
MALQHSEAGLAGHAFHFGGQARFADAGLARQDDGLALAQAHLLYELPQNFDIGAAPDEQRAQAERGGRRGVGHARLPERDRCGWSKGARTTVF